MIQKQAYIALDCGAESARVMVGILQQGQLPDLARGLTVIYGGNGSGKTTLVSFLRGILFGFTSEHLGYHADDLRFGGTLLCA